MSWHLNLQVITTAAYDGDLHCLSKKWFLVFFISECFFSIDNLGHFFGYHNLLIRTMVWMIVTQVKLSIRGAYYRLLRTLICYEKWIDSILAVCTFLSSYELNLRSCSQENTWLDPGSFKHSVHSINHRTLCRLPRTPSLLSSPPPQPHPHTCVIISRTCWSPVPASCAR